MRLVHIKLAGFKSFVDPTSINVPGKLVGVVGPNGCGKSNIIDAVRWVLGESRASALRGDSMQDVIFSGSSQRSPVARASVELLFDNSMGKAAGQWSQYSEISVKRVLERNGDSSYFINNVHVRRRDVHDIFLGTGLGPRAYAIIEQGMISRIIEAKPEELRIFLEEAAGVSKYKDRRRETENRLADTKENLARVDDIRQELAGQIEKLQSQAEVAKRFVALNEDRIAKQNQLWLLRKREAESDLERHSRELAQSIVTLDADIARLREVERELEEIRSRHYDAADAVTRGQAEFYQCNTEVSRLEAEIRFITERRAGLEQRKKGQEEILATSLRQAKELEEAQLLWGGQLERAQARVGAAEVVASQERNLLPEAEAAWRGAREALSRKRDAVAHASQALSLAQAGIDHSGRTLANLVARNAKIQADLTGLVPPDEIRATAVAADLADCGQSLANKEQSLLESEAARSRTASERDSLNSDLRVKERELASLESRISTLNQIQRSRDDNTSGQEWLSATQLTERPRFWQRISVEPGWEAAVESVLSDRLHALELDSVDSIDKLLDSPPPVRMVAFSPTGGMPVPSEATADLPGRPLSSLIKVLDEHLQAFVVHWLSGFRAIDSRVDPDVRKSLPSSILLVSREGHRYGRYEVTFNSLTDENDGVLERQREISELSMVADELSRQVEEKRSELTACHSALTQHEAESENLRRVCAELRDRIHDFELTAAELRQAANRFRELNVSLVAAAAEVHAEIERETSARQSAADRVSLLEHELASSRLALEQASADLAALEHQLAARRDSLNGAERDLQEARFLEKECRLKLAEIDRTLGNTRQQSDAAESAIASMTEELSVLQDVGLRADLEAALEKRSAQEHELATLRNAQEELGAILKSFENRRIDLETGLIPLRERIAELRLKEQAARLSSAQFTAQLAEAGADEAALAMQLRNGQRPASLQAEISRLAASLADLGPVNMAALEELASCQGRKEFLDAQGGDLAQALETLEFAIRKIDRETRELLKGTFERVNEQFGVMFPALFGGGEAKLIMTGEEVLDSGVQVMARPPGKKNSTIHLLSGGEKALTAIALVFSMFQLNPAPFCLLDEVDAPLDDANTIRFCDLVRRMAQQTQFLFISHNKLTMELASQLIGVTMQEQGVSRVVAVDINEALQLREPLAA